jgi:ketosteroid isomerase-like protein
VSQANVESVRAFMPPDGTDLVVVFGRAGAFPSEGLVRDDASVRFVSPSAEMEGTGSEGFYETWQDWLSPWESYRMYVEELLDRGDRVVALVQLVGVTKRDGVEMGHPGATVFRFEGDQIAEIVFTMDRDGALAG